MAMLHDLIVKSVRVQLPETGAASGATTYMTLEAKTPDGTAVTAVANFSSASFPTNQDEFMSLLWDGAFGEAFGALGHILPEVPEWSPWPIV